MKKINFKKAKDKVIKYCQSDYPEFVLDSEFNAIITHWLLEPTIRPPLMPEDIFIKCQQLFTTKNSKTEHSPYGVREEHALYQTKFSFCYDDIRFPPTENPAFSFIDLFAGIGGFRLAMQSLGGKCVFSSEWDKYAKQTYEANYGEIPYGDIRKIDEQDIPDHDVLCAGFPCQPFSLAGISARNSLNTAHGFACKTQGTLFFDVARIIEAKKPRIAFLENVKNLVSHDNGKTFSVIKDTIESLGYSFSYKLINSSPLVPQKRIRCYMVCIREDDRGFNFPVIDGPPLALRTILEDNVDPSYTISSKLWQGHQRRTKHNLERGTGFTAFCADLDKPSNTIVARYGKDGKECLIPQEQDNPRMLTPRECARLQGFPESFVIPTGKTTAYRQFGNSVAVPVISRISENIVKCLLNQK